MNKVFLGLWLAVAILVVSAFSLPQNKKTLANVKQDNGLYVFIESTPVSDYETLGNVKKTGLVMNGKAEEMVKIITRRAKDDYPTCDAVIFDDLKLDHATVIKFK